MITSSVVLYKSKPSEVERIIGCALNSIIDKVYVVDNSPTDTLRSIVESLGHQDKVEYIYGQGNVGYGDGNNIAFEKTLELKSDYHVVLNPDIIFKPEVIQTLRNFMERHQDVGISTPMLEYTDGSFQASGMLLPTPFTIFGRKFLSAKTVHKINKEYELLRYDLTVPRNVPNICGCFLFIRVSDLERVGMFDSRYFMYYEDFDLVRRFHKITKTVYYPIAKVIHAHNAEHRRNRKLMLLSIRSTIKYFNKWGWFFDLDRRNWNKAAVTDKSIIKD